jgi:hypothetical protein
MSTGPIFLAGLAGCGKTPLRRALCRHPAIEITRRTRLWRRFDGRFGDLDQPPNLDRCLEALCADPGVSALDPDPTRLRRDMAAATPSYALLFRRLHEHHVERLGKRRWGEQYAGAEADAAQLLTILPDARMIHVMDDPVAGYARAADGGRDLPGRLGWETAAWVASARIAVVNLARFRGRYLVLRYDALVAEPKRTLETVCAFVGERYHPQLFDGMVFESAPGPHDPVVAQVDGRFLRAAAGDLLDSLGYEPPDVPPAAPWPRAAARLARRSVDRAAMALRPAVDRTPTYLHPEG